MNTSQFESRTEHVGAAVFVAVWRSVDFLLMLLHLVRERLSGLEEVGQTGLSTARIDKEVSGCRTLAIGHKDRAMNKRPKLFVGSPLATIL